MDTIPLVYLKKGKLGKLQDTKWIPQAGNTPQIQIGFYNKHEEIYVIDLDGYKKNRANLDFYRLVSRKISLWVDAAPRFPEDVMDLFVSGANKITLMWKLIKNADLIEIRDMCTGELYLSDEGKIGETLIKINKLGYDGMVVKTKANMWQSSDKPVWVIRTGEDGEEELKRLNP